MLAGLRQGPHLEAVRARGYLFKSRPVSGPLDVVVPMHSDATREGE